MGDNAEYDILDGVLPPDHPEHPNNIARSQSEETEEQVVVERGHQSNDANPNDSGLPSNRYIHGLQERGMSASLSKESFCR